MSNKDFEEKVLSALGTMQTDITGLKQDFVYLNTKIDKVETNLNTKIDKVETNLNAKIDKVETNLNAKIDKVETNLNAKIDKLDEKIDQQTYDLKQTMNAHSTYLHQAFEHISRIDRTNFIKNNNISYA